MYCKCGSLEEARLVFERITHKDVVAWNSMIVGYAMHGLSDVALQLFDEMCRLGYKPTDITLIGVLNACGHSGLVREGTYVLLSNLYAKANNWEGVAKVRTMMRDGGVEKEHGCSSIEVNNRVHEFVAGDSWHPRSNDIHMMLEKMNVWVKAQGHTPRTDTVLHDLGEEEKEKSLGVHSEKLAMAFGLISTEPGATIRIVKNLRVCSDCHDVMKLVSKITRRAIVMRDRNRFHHFNNGSCSCGDYW
ncbi:unnamed protein product [Linum tenue]|uniref:DYW domain-containing protein n=1 Tax=Linum tenue TaxID=586396 RepID=A0AAV0J8G9_9ROSI|nr:unnamed protein product [Linum tenue]